MKHLIPLLFPFALFSCNWFAKAPEPAPSPSQNVTPSVTPSPSVGAIPMGQTFKIYYAEEPDTAKSYGDVNVYDQDVRIFPEYRAKLAHLIATKTKGKYNCGYIALGYSESKSIHVAPGKYVNVLTTQEFKDLLDDWLKIPGVNCLLADMAGYDYAYDSHGKSTSSAAKAAWDARFMDIANYAHAKGIPVIWNAWAPEDVQWAKLGASDWYLFEDAQGDKGRNYVRWKYWSEHRPAGSRAYAVTTGSYDKASLEAAAAKYGVSGIQFKTNAQFENED